MCKVVPGHLTERGGKDLWPGVQGAGLPLTLKKVAEQNVEWPWGMIRHLCGDQAVFILRPTRCGPAARGERDLENEGA